MICNKVSKIKCLSLELYVCVPALALTAHMMPHKGYHDLQLPAVTVTDSGKCITMEVLHIHGQLQLWVRDSHSRTVEGFNIDDKLVWHQAHALGPVWNKVSVYLQPADDVTVQPLLHSEYDGSLTHETIPVAIDNILVTDGPCYWNQGA